MVGKDKLWPLPDEKLAEYLETYAHLDVHRELRAALQWCRDNPAKRKTARGMAAFLNRWMMRTQDAGRGGKGPSKADDWFAQAMKEIEIPDPEPEKEPKREAE